MARWWVPVIGMLVVVSLPVTWHDQMTRRERAVQDLMLDVHHAQERFRSSGGRGGYATALASLVTPCPGEAAGALDVVPEGDVLDVRGYRVTLRAAQDARAGGPDCHGRLTMSDYYVAAAPGRIGVDGGHAYAMMAGGRVFVFFDGIPPREDDMAPGGLATPVAELGEFKIP